jgi:hypothetical protein
MIPYDDLVAALSSWRARQGLPVNTVTAGSGPAPSPGSGPYAAQPGSGPYAAQAGSGPYAAYPGSGPTEMPDSGPHRGAPPAPPPAAADELVVDDAAMLAEEAYESEGNDFAMSFAPGEGPQNDPEATAIGELPERPTEADLGRDRDDW